MSDISFQQFEKQLRQLLNSLSAEDADARLTSITLELPGQSFPVMPDTGSSCFYWARPQKQRCLVATGEVIRLVEQGVERFDHLQQQFEQLQHHWLHIGDHHPEDPLAFFCYAFDPDEHMTGWWSGLPNSCVIVPKILLDYTCGHCFVTFTADAESLHGETLVDQWMLTFTALMNAVQTPADSCDAQPLQRSEVFPQDHQWIARVEQAVADIRRSDLNKVVLSRRIRVEGESAFSAAQLMTRLIQRYPGCTLFAARVDGVMLVAATPERLVSLHNGELKCDAMAGTVAANEIPDERMVKYEHLPVVHTIEQILAPLCEQLEIPDKPQLLQLHGLQHIWTPIHASVKSDVALLKLVAALHPTPAVSGVPDHVAREWLMQNDDHQRGWYCGGFGWMSSGGEGHASVMLRCALLQGNRAELFAGAGITAYSDPHSEFRETELKLQTILDLL
ncbi:MAG: isochorismate synthase [Gammaproteobacteria bacterium]|nr:isochorismate synthase [Gammaproteobacteria bacterium]